MNFTISEETTNKIINPLKEVKKLRQKPAHVIEENLYNSYFYEKQNYIVKEVYLALKELRSLLNVHLGETNNLDEYPVEIY